MNYYPIIISILWIVAKPKVKLLNRKPFNCELCIAFWLTFVIQWQLNWEIVYMACLNGLLAPLVLNLFNKIHRILLK